VYVIDGSMIFGLDDREPVVLKAGESFYEQPGALHSVSRNRQPGAASEPDHVLRARGWPVRDRPRR
jgi:quercetin dioxygenase-like cupin family protein